jgi:hypothetical protein
MRNTPHVHPDRSRRPLSRRQLREPPSRRGARHGAEVHPRSREGGGATTKKVRAAFALEPITLRLDQILPTRPFQEVVKQTPKYKAIAASVREVGIIEPLVVHPQKGDKYLLLERDRVPRHSRRSADLGGYRGRANRTR